MAWDLALFAAGIAVTAAGPLIKRWWGNRERLQEASGVAAYLRVALELWLEVAREEGWPVPEPRFRAAAAAE